MDGISDSGSEQAARVEILPNRFGTYCRGNLQRNLIIRKPIFSMFRSRKMPRGLFVAYRRSGDAICTRLYLNSDPTEFVALYFQQVAERVFRGKTHVKSLHRKT
jgi:hypothetical protein